MVNSNVVSLIALKDFSHSVGFVEAGGEFGASHTYAASLIKEGVARLKDEGDSHLLAGFKKPIPAGRWAAGRVVILASGPSLTKEDVEIVREWRNAETKECRRVMVVNTTYQAALWADALYAADLSWWKVYTQKVAAGEWPKFEGECWTQTEPGAKMYNLKLVVCERRPGLSHINGIIHNGGNSGYQAMGLAAMFGAREEILLGFDMHATKGRDNHWHGAHPKPLRQSSPYENFLRAFGPLAADMKKKGIIVKNSTRKTALKCFTCVPLEEALA